MKGAWIALLIALGLLIFLGFTSKVYNTSGTLDIQLHDTFFVLSYTTVIIFIILFLGTFFSIGGIIGTHFKSNLFWVLIILFLSIDIYLLVPFFKV
jgi:hypothetical protein